jgi:carboxypeptidase C (cathepsin A)
MTKFILPDKITVKLIKQRQQDFPVDNILLYIKTSARHKNDFYLGPFVSDKNGVVTITKNDINNEVTATYESGLMDYSSIENSFTFVELRLYDQDEIDRMIQSRTKVWTSLLKGEKERWTSINHLVDTLKKSNNKHLLLYDSTKRIRADFDGTQNEYEFQFDIYKK